MNTPDESALWATPDPVCPYCGCEMEDSFELSEGDGEIECGDCYRPFRYSRQVVVEFTTEPIMGPHRLSAIEQEWDRQQFPMEKNHDDD